MKKFFFFVFTITGIAAVPFVVLAQTATLSFVPAVGTVQTGQFVTVTIVVNTGATQVNAVGVYFAYPENLLEGISLDTAGSALDTFTPQKTIGGGKVSFEAGKLPPPLVGFQKLFSATFRAKSTLGSAQLAFTPDSAVLTHGESKNILNLAGSLPATFQIVVPLPVAPPPPPTPTPPVQTPPSSPVSLLTISDIRAEKVSEERVRISWKTNQATRGSVNYGPSSQEAYPFSFLSGLLETEHSFVLSDIKLSENYSLEIIGVDEQGNQVKAESLILADLLQEERALPPPQSSNGEDEGGGFEIRSPMLLIFVGLPLFVLLLASFLIFLRMRSRP